MRGIAITLFLLYFGSSAEGQVLLSIDQCEALFVKSNLKLIAEEFNIKVARADVVQARIWDLPYLSGEFNLINPQDGRVFDVGSRGQKGLAIQQLISLGGKKRNEVEFGQNNVVIAELQYEQVLRNLRLAMRESFYDLYFAQAKSKRITDKLENIDTLISLYNIQANLGNIPLKDLVRLQTLGLSLKNELLEIQKIIFGEREKLKLFLNTQNDIIANEIMPDIDLDWDVNNDTIMENLFQKSITSNPDYLTYLKVIESNELFRKWQVSLSSPDVTVGASYDQRGGAFGNQVNLTLGIPLNLWNRNKGNIKASEFRYDQSKILLEQKKNELHARFQSTLQSYRYQLDQIRQSEASFRNLELLYNGTLLNFQKRNISLLEFSDFMESYIESVIYLNDMTNQLVISRERINFFLLK